MVHETVNEPRPPFYDFSQDIQPQSVLRAAITSAYRRSETECVPWLLDQAHIPQEEKVSALAVRLVEALRSKRSSGSVESLIQEFSLSSQEGIALMCLAEALLRIPDRPTRDALIRDKIAKGDWKSHTGGPSLFVNAATWGLMLTGKLVAINSEQSLSNAMARFIGKGGEPLVRRGVNMAMRLMGEQFVSGQTISEALANNRSMEAKGFRYSYDMLGEAAMTSDDALMYYEAYEQAIHAIGNANASRGIYEGGGISIKLSALHPRYSRAQHDRVMSELLPRVQTLTRLARQYDLGINIDAEEADRLELSLDLLEALCFDPALEGWNGIGFVVQAYQKRTPFVLDYIIDLARRSRHRLMIRLVKGAYWDTEIKRAQVDGLEGYPVYTRKVYTDISYLACARKLLAAPDAVFPQFATHNAYTLSAIYHMAGQNYYPGQYEFQCLHGMGESLYEEVVGPVAQGKLNRPCRIYAPVGTHETLLAYLVRRLLENGANTSFVNQIGDRSIPIAQLVANPVDVVRSITPIGAPHDQIPLPRELYADGSENIRLNSSGIDLSNEQRLASLAAAMLSSTNVAWRAQPTTQAKDGQPGHEFALSNPAELRDIVGHVQEASDADIAAAIALAKKTGPIWQSTPVEARARCLINAANLLESRMQTLLGLIIREAGKTLPNAIAEVREAVDFLRYYAKQIEQEFDNTTHRPLGPVVCISPWNFPLAIFLGQVSAALAAGNTVLAKPAEQTPLIAAQAIAILHEAGVPQGAVQLLPGRGETVGAALISSSSIRGVLFTGSIEVAHSISQALADRLNDEGRPIPLIAETGGQNTMIVDSSALSEQVVADVLTSAFDSAGQRCSALRILCLQEDCADRVMTMLQGAMHELRIGNPDLLSTDVGPVIDADARTTITAHINAMRQSGHTVLQVPMPPQTRYGTFIPPTLIEINSIAELKHEVFGPVLHVLRYQRDDLGTLIDAINATGYGLTFGIHTRIDETIEKITQTIKAGNIYVNRNIVGAVVGVQPFGGEGLSGTGPKAGGPLYLYRLLSERPETLPPSAVSNPDNAGRQTLCGPTGELNTYQLLPRGVVLCIAHTDTGARLQHAISQRTGNRVLFMEHPSTRRIYKALPEEQRATIQFVAHDDLHSADFQGVLFDGDSDTLRDISRHIASRPGPLTPIQSLSPEAIAAGAQYFPDFLLKERSMSTNTAAAGGNASLMSIS